MFYPSRRDLHELFSDGLDRSRTQMCPEGSRGDGEPAKDSEGVLRVVQVGFFRGVHVH